MRLYDIFSGEELKVAEKIQQRRLQILVHSYLYYKMDKPVVSDADWDKWARELVSLQKDNPEVLPQVPYAREFEDWDGSTGAFFEFSPQIEHIAHRLARTSSTAKNDVVKKLDDKVTKKYIKAKLF